eukprot:jgi/Botrbrau1/4869/Bobra.0032s0025.1
MATLTATVATAIAGTTAFLTWATTLFEKARAGFNGIRKARWQRKDLAVQLGLLARDIEQTQAKCRGNNIPVTEEGISALNNLKKFLDHLDGRVRELQEEIEGLENDMESFRQGGPAHVPGRTHDYGVAEAWAPPDWVSDLPKLSLRLQQVLKAATDSGAFLYRTTFCGVAPELYVRPKGQYDGVLEYLALPQERSSGNRAVVIYGGRGMGKTVFAMDIAHTFANDPEHSKHFPRGVFWVDCGQEGTTSTPESAQRALLNMLQGTENKDPDIKGTEGPDITRRLHKAMQGQRCLVVLDNVKNSKMLHGFRPHEFEGALLVTCNNGNLRTELSGCLSVNFSHNLFWSAEEGSGDRIAHRILAKRASKEGEETYPTGCEKDGNELVCLCKGSVLALVVIGKYLYGKKTPEQWENVKNSLALRLQRRDRLPGDYPNTVFGALDLVLEDLPEDSKAVMLAVSRFRAGAPLPFPLVKLAVEVESGREWDPDALELSLEDVVGCNLLEVCDSPAFVGASRCKMLQEGLPAAGACGHVAVTEVQGEP